MLKLPKPRGSNSIHLGPSNSQVLRPPNTSGVSYGGVRSCIGASGKQDLRVFRFWPRFSQGPNRLTFHVWVPKGATEGVRVCASDCFEGTFFWDCLKVKPNKRYPLRGTGPPIFRHNLNRVKVDGNSPKQLGLLTQSSPYPHKGKCAIYVRAGVLVLGSASSEGSPKGWPVRFQFPRMAEAQGEDQLD